MIFYAKECTSGHDSYTLSETESKHCVRVLRDKIGDEIEIINGLGEQFICKIIDDHHKRCEVQIVKKIVHSHSEQMLHIAMAIPKSSDRLEWFMEKATEVGINKLSLINCEHSERKSFNEKRLEKITVSALKQSKRFHLPIIEAPTTFESFLEKHPKGYIGHCKLDEKIRANTMKEVLPFLIGPEGDFSNEEIRLAKDSGYISVQLSQNRLRTETAALSAVFYLSDLL